MRSLSAPGKDNVPSVVSAADTGQSVVAGVLRVDSGGVIWAVSSVEAPPWFQVWRWSAVTLGLAGLLLVIATGHLGVVIQRSAKQLTSSLLSLSHDLSAPIQKPSVRELSDVAEGISRLAGELLTAQQERDRLNKQLAEKERLASLGRVAAGLAHEVRNPLAAIKLRVDLAAFDSHVPSTVRSELSAVSSEISRLDRLVSDLQILAGRRIGPLKSTDLRSLAEQRAHALRPWAAEKNVTISVDGEAHCMADPDGVSRVLDNLVKNAVEASPSGEVVGLSLRVENSRAWLVVRDKGAGVEKARESELFEPFFTTKTEGMGLGLALSRAIAEAHQGSLRYYRKDSCTHFELVLDLNSSSQ
jgi:signal transduction histidine kinase